MTKQIMIIERPFLGQRRQNALFLQRKKQKLLYNNLQESVYLIAVRLKWLKLLYSVLQACTPHDRISEDPLPSLWAYRFLDMSAESLVPSTSRVIKAIRP